MLGATHHLVRGATDKIDVRGLFCQFVSRHTITIGRPPQRPIVYSREEWLSDLGTVHSREMAHAHSV
jgi:hypothetical protein